MLDEVTLADATAGHVGHKAVHHVQLVIAWEDEPLGILHDVRYFFLRLGLAVIKQHIVLDDVGQYIWLQHLLPQVGGLVAALLVDGVACALSIG